MAATVEVMITKRQRACKKLVGLRVQNGVARCLVMKPRTDLVKLFPIEKTDWGERRKIVVRDISLSVVKSKPVSIIFLSAVDEKIIAVIINRSDAINANLKCTLAN